MIGKAALAYGDYHYCPLVPGRTITGYNMEEQAEMVQDLFLIGRDTNPLRLPNQACGTAGSLTPVFKPTGGLVPFRG